MLFVPFLFRSKFFFHSGTGGLSSFGSSLIFDSDGATEPLFSNCFCFFLSEFIFIPDMPKDINQKGSILDGSVLDGAYLAWQRPLEVDQRVI